MMARLVHSMCDVVRARPQIGKVPTAGSATHSLWHKQALVHACGDNIQVIACTHLCKALVASKVAHPLSIKPTQQGMKISLWSIIRQPVCCSSSIRSSEFQQVCAISPKILHIKHPGGAEAVAAHSWWFALHERFMSRMCSHAAFSQGRTALTDKYGLEHLPQVGQRSMWAALRDSENSVSI